MEPVKPRFDLSLDAPPGPNVALWGALLVMLLLLPVMAVVAWNLMVAREPCVEVSAEQVCVTERGDRLVSRDHNGQIVVEYVPNELELDAVDPGGGG